MASGSAWADFFDGHAPAYDDNVFTKNTLREIDFLLDELRVPPGGSILDVGCGTGRHSVELARRGYAVTGVDISSGMLSQARRRAEAAGVHVEWIRSDAAAFVPGRLHDAAICLCEGAFGLLGDRDDPIAQPLAILRAVSAGMKPGARCLFTVLNGYAIARRHAPQSWGRGFDPLSLTEVSECNAPGAPPGITLHERGFVPTELVLLFGLSGLGMLGIWGGTAGNWGKRPIDPDEIEIMVLAWKPDAPPGDPFTLPI